MQDQKNDLVQILFSILKSSRDNPLELTGTPLIIDHNINNMHDSLKFEEERNFIPHKPFSENSLQLSKQPIFESSTSEEILNVIKIEKNPKLQPNKSLKTNKSFICAFEGCGKRFDYKWILDRHINSHFCFKLHKCDYSGCDKAYKSRENLNLHIRNKHLGEKPYQCRYCTSRFSHRNGKTYHERKVHINYLPHKCPMNECNLSFASKSALSYHSINQHQ